MNSDSFSHKFEGISSNPNVIDAVKTRAKWALYNRDGKFTEEIYAISLDNGREISRITNQNNPFGIKRTKAFSRKIALADAEKEPFVLIHNHPRGLPPSISDINALIKTKHGIGMTVGHDGSLYVYTRSDNNLTIKDSDWNIALRHYKGFSEITSMEKALEELSKMYGFSFYKL